MRIVKPEETKPPVIVEFTSAEVIDLVIALTDIIQWRSNTREYIPPTFRELYFILQPHV